MEKNLVLIKAPSILGLRPSGVEKMPEALENAGLTNLLNIEEVRTVVPPNYNPQRDIQTQMLNPEGLAAYAIKLANSVQTVITEDKFPIVVGGDCSIILGNMLALKRIGRFGLFFMDGHADFYQPEKSTTGEAADMDLALVSGRGPEIITNLENQKPFVKDEDVVLFGQRDREETILYGSQQVSETTINVYELETIKKQGVILSAQNALQKLLEHPISGFWIHIDVDVLDDAIMPAVDYRLPGGLRFEELNSALNILLSSGKAVGLSLSIFNPKLDADGTIAKNLVKSIAEPFCQKS
jgi:arginase